MTLYKFDSIPYSKNTFVQVRLKKRRGGEIWQGERGVNGASLSSGKSIYRTLYMEN